MAWQQMAGFFVASFGTGIIISLAMFLVDYIRTEQRQRPDERLKMVP